VAEDAGPLRPASLYRSPKLVSARSSKSGAITLSPSPGSSLRVATGRRKLSGFSRQHIICALCSSTPPTFFLAQTNPLPRLLSPSSSLIPLRSGVWIHPVSTPPPACVLDSLRLHFEPPHGHSFTVLTCTLLGAQSGVTVAACSGCLLAYWACSLAKQSLRLNPSSSRTPHLHNLRFSRSDRRGLVSSDI
jgi:hypothetical protein